MMDTAALPLAGLLVADFSVTVPGPYCSHVLRALGAQVVHLEPPSGDPQRALMPQAFNVLSRGKQSVAVDLKTETGRQTAIAVLDRADIVIEAWRPGVADRLGVGYTVACARNPKVVYCSISGYGQSGSLAGRAGHDVNYLAMAGALKVGMYDGIPLADFAGANSATIMILAALHKVTMTGVGAHLDISLTGSLMDWLDAFGIQPGEKANSPIFVLPHYGTFETADRRTVTFGVAIEDGMWAALIGVLGRPDWGDLAMEERIERTHEIRAYITEQIAALTAMELENRLSEIDTCWAFEHIAGETSSVGGRLPVVNAPAPALDSDRERWVSSTRSLDEDQI